MVLTVLDGLALFFSVIMRFWQAPLGLVIVLALVVATGLGAWTMALDPRRDALLFDPVPDDRA